MSIDQVAYIGRQVIVTGILLVLPTVAVSLIVGLVISIFQTITSIQEQTLSFAPRILAVGIILCVTLPWSLRILVQFTLQMLWRATEMRM